MAEQTAHPDETTFPLSLQQEFLRMVDHGDDSGPFGPRYTIAGGWRIRGPLDPDVLWAALRDVVDRHEALRTSLVFDGDDVHQRLRPTRTPDLLIRELPDGDDAERERIAEELVNEVEAGTFAIDEFPLVRFVLGRFDRTDAVLVFLAHHTAVDGWSAQILFRDLAACYAARREGRAPDLPPTRQPREYVAWQRANSEGPAVTAARAYWRETLKGGQMVAIPTDLPRPEHGDFVTGYHRFLLEEELRVGLLETANRTHSSPFMVVLSAYLLHLRGQTGENDLIVPTFTPGRTWPSWAPDIIGSYYNFLPLRTDISGCTTIEEVIPRARRSCVNAYANEIPFMQLMEEAPELMNAALEPRGAACVLQVIQSPFIMGGESVGDLTYTAMRRRLISSPVGSQVPDGGLIGLEPHPEGGIIGSVGYTRNLFVESTIATMMDEFADTLRATVLPRAQRLAS